MLTKRQIDDTSWTGEQVRELLQRIEGPAFKLGYYTCLSGSVAYQGYSLKDLDLVFVPKWRGEQPDDTALKQLLDENGIWSLRRDSAEVGYREDPSDRTRDIYTGYIGEGDHVSRKRVDVIIINFNSNPPNSTEEKPF